MSLSVVLFSRLCCLKLYIHLPFVEYNKILFYDGRTLPYAHTEEQTEHSLRYAIWRLLSLHPRLIGQPLLDEIQAIDD
jgi:hypothetical protein